MMNTRAAVAWTRHRTSEVTRAGDSVPVVPQRRRLGWSAKGKVSLGLPLGRYAVATELEGAVAVSSAAAVAYHDEPIPMERWWKPRTALATPRGSARQVALRHPEGVSTGELS